MEFDVCIIGGGAAGLMAGIFASGSGRDVVIVESNTVVGRKLLKTGRGRCNLTHVGSVDDFVKAYGECGRFLKHSLHEFSPEAVRSFFAKHRLATKVEGAGCVFPMSDRASDVKRVLEDKVRRERVKFIYGKKAETINRAGESFIVKAGSERFNCGAVVIATGGVSWSFTGSTGDGYEFARSFGHNIVEPKAALVGLVSPENWCGSLQGVGIEEVKLTVAGRGRLSVCGPVMFTGNGIGGPAVFDLSRKVTESLGDGKEIEVFMDLMPQVDRPSLDKLIVSSCQSHGRKELAGLLTGQLGGDIRGKGGVRALPRALAIYLCKRLDRSGEIIAGHLQKEKRQELVELIKHLPIKIISVGPIEEATITRGGLDRKEINPRTMESKLCKGLFFAGEVVDVDGPCGGYNLQIAWSTGALAGKSAANF